MKLTNTEAIADEGKVIRRKGETDYCSRCTLYPNKSESKADFEEIPMSEYEQIRKAEEAKLMEGGAE